MELKKEILNKSLPEIMKKIEPDVFNTLSLDKKENLIFDIQWQDITKKSF